MESRNDSDEPICRAETDSRLREWRLKRLVDTVREEEVGWIESSINIYIYTTVFKIDS